MSEENKELPRGRITQVLGAVVDVEFPRGSVPGLFNALHADITFGALAKTLTLEVAQHLGENAVDLFEDRGIKERGVVTTDLFLRLFVPVKHLHELESLFLEIIRDGFFHRIFCAGESNRANSGSLRCGRAVWI